MKVDKFVVLKEHLAREIFRELGDIVGLDKYPALRKLEIIIAETLEFKKEE